MKNFLLLFISVFILIFCDAWTQTQTINNGATTYPVDFSVGSCTYNWVNNMPGIGLPASGTGSIPSFTAVNTGTSPVTATILAIPSSANAYIANSATKGNVTVVNTQSNSVVATIAVGNVPVSVAASPNGSYVYVANSFSNNVSVISAATNTVIATIPVGKSPQSVSVSHDDSKVFVSNVNDETISVINAASNTVTATIAGFNQAFSIAASPTANVLYVVNSGGNTLSVVNTSTNTLTTMITVGTSPNQVVVSPDGSRVYVTNLADNTISAINAATNSVIATIAVGLTPEGLTVSPDGSLLYAGIFNAADITVINTSTNAIVKTIHAPSPQGMSITADGKSLYVANNAGNAVSVINTTTGIISATLPVGTDPNSFGNFIAGGVGCAPGKYTITVNPDDGAMPTITASNTSGSIFACLGTASASPNIQQFTLSGSDLTGGITATPDPDFEISLSPGSGYASSLILAESGGIVNTTTIYVRSKAGGTAGSLTEQVKLTSPGAMTVNAAVQGKVYEEAMANQISPQTFTGATETTAIDFTGTATNYTWTNSSPAIGLAESGSGNIAPFVAINTGSAPITATISVTPVTSGGATGGNITCTGTPMTFTITVTPDASPTPTITASNTTGSIFACLGTASVSPNIQQFTVSGSSLTSGITVAPNNADFEVSVSPNSGYAASLTLAESGGDVATTTIYVRAAATGTSGSLTASVVLTSAGAAAVGAAVQGKVYEEAMVNPISPQTFINGTQTTAIDFTGTATNYNWVNDTPSIGLAASGSGNIAPFTATNASSTPITATITVTPVTSGGATGGNITCTGTPVTFTITVGLPNPPVITAAGELPPLVTTYGTPSASTIFTVSATALTAGILVTPPTGFEVSTDDVTFTSTVTIGTSGTLATTQVYIRLAATTPVGDDAYGGNIVLTSPTAPTVDLTMPLSTVNPAPLTITAADKSKVYGAVNPVLTATYSGFVNNETDAVFTTPPVLATSAVTNSPVGQYPIVVSGGEAANYTIISYINGILTVLPEEQDIVIPNTFTPNGDGINDTWNIQFLAYYINCSVNIFNRWGQNVFTSIGYPTAWNGTYKGSQVPVGTYYYVINLKNGLKPLSGFVAVIR